MNPAPVLMDMSLMIFVSPSATVAQASPISCRLNIPLCQFSCPHDACFFQGEKMKNHETEGQKLWETILVV